MEMLRLESTKFVLSQKTSIKYLELITLTCSFPLSSLPHSVLLYCLRLIFCGLLDIIEKKCICEVNEIFCRAAIDFCFCRKFRPCILFDQWNLWFWTESSLICLIKCLQHRDFGEGILVISPRFWCFIGVYTWMLLARLWIWLAWREQMKMESIRESFMYDVLFKELFRRVVADFANLW